MHSLDSWPMNLVHQASATVYLILHVMFLMGEVQIWKIAEVCYIVSGQPGCMTWTCLLFIHQQGDYQIWRKFVGWELGVWTPDLSAWQNAL